MSMQPEERVRLYLRMVRVEMDDMALSSQEDDRWTDTQTNSDLLAAERVLEWVLCEAGELPFLNEAFVARLEQDAVVRRRRNR